MENQEQQPSATLLLSSVKPRALNQVKEFHQYAGHPIGDTIKLLTNERAAARVGYIESELVEFLDDTKLGMFVGAFDAILDAYYFLLGNCVEMGITHEMLYEGFHEVHRANMTKFCKTQKEAIDTCSAYDNGTHPLKPTEVYDPVYEKRGDYWIVFDFRTKKILKSIYTEAPNLKPIVDKYLHVNSSGTI